MVQFELYGEKVEDEESREAFKKALIGNNDDFETYNDAIQVLVGSCDNFKTIHPLDINLYHEKDHNKFVRVINYHSSISVKYNEFGYSLTNDCRIIIKDV